MFCTGWVTEFYCFLVFSCVKVYRIPNTMAAYELVSDKAFQNETQYIKLRNTYQQQNHKIKSK